MRLTRSGAMTTITRTLLAALLPLTLGAVAGPAAAADPQPVQPFVPGINEDPALSEAWQHWQAKGIDDFQLNYALETLRRTAPGAVARAN